MFKYNYHRIVISSVTSDVSRAMTREEFKAFFREWRSFNTVKLRSCTNMNLKNDAVYHASGLFFRHCPQWLAISINGGFTVRFKESGAILPRKTKADRIRDLEFRELTIRTQKNIDRWNANLFDVPLV